MSVIAYIRKSTDKQSFEHQEFEIEQYAKKNNLKIDMRQKVVQFRLIGKVFISPAAGYRFNQYLHFTSLCFIRIFIDFLHFPTH